MYSWDGELFSAGKNSHTVLSKSDDQNSASQINEPRILLKEENIRTIDCGAYFFLMHLENGEISIFFFL